MEYFLGVLLGPILLIQDVAWENQATGVVACLLLIPCLLVGFLRPRPWSIAVTTVALFAWWLLGCIGMGINC